MPDKLEMLPALDVRVPTWDVAALTERGCPLCNVNSPKLLLRPDGLPLAVCITCGLWFVSLLPPVEAIGKMYEGYWNTHRPADLTSRTAERMKRQLLWAEDGSRVLKRVGAILGGLTSKRIVEIGCGTGRVLLEARARGANVLGNDISPEVCAFVRDRLEIPVHQGQPNDCFATAGGSFDAIIMIDVIEHLIDPRAVLNTAWTALKPGGVLAITTPNGGAAGENSAEARTWVGFSVDLEHLQYISSKTIYRMALTARWSIEHLETFGYPDLDWLTVPIRPPSAPRFQMTDVIHRFPRKTILRKGLAAARALRRVCQAPAGGSCGDPHAGTYQLFAVLRRK